MALMSLDEARIEFARRLRTFHALLNNAGLHTKITCLYRSDIEQNALYAQGRTKPGKRVTNARAWESPHNWKLAADFVFLKPGGGITYEGNWKLFGKLAKQANLNWGGRWLRFKDRPHVELPNWKLFTK